MVAFRKHIQDGKKRSQMQLKCSRWRPTTLPRKPDFQNNRRWQHPPADNQDHPCEVAGESTVWSFFI